MKIKTLFLLLFIASALSAEAVTRHALVFGIGTYQDKAWGKIHGDVDADYVKRMLGGCGFSDITVLKNQNATKSRMVAAFKALAARCRGGDVVYVHYSGHGQLMTDVNGDEALRGTLKHGNWDEAWIPYDAYMSYCASDRGEKHFCDDEVEQYLTAIRKKIGRTGKLIVVIDSCHSGDATCGGEDECVRGVDQKFNIPLQPNRTLAKSVKQEQWLTVSACKPYQLATEMKGVNIGKLTYAIYSMGKAFFTLSNDKLQERLNAFMEMNRGQLPQDPVVSGQK